MVCPKGPKLNEFKRPVSQCHQYVINADLAIGHLNLSLLTIDGLDRFSFADIGDLTAGIENVMVR